MTAEASTLPHWDMSVVYPDITSPEFDEGMAAAFAHLDELVQRFDALGIDRQDGAAVDDETVAALEEIIDRFNVVLDETTTISAYIYAFVSTDSRNTTAQARLSEFDQQMVKLSQLSIRLTAWLGSVDVEALIQRSEAAREHAFMLRYAKQSAEHLMSPTEEALAAEMNVTGGNAWGKLQDNVTAQLSVPIELRGEHQELPMSMIRNLAYERDRDVRRTGYEAELAAWERVSVPLAAALNSIKGETNLLTAKRGWSSALDAAVFHNHMDRESLDAMMQAAHESFPDFRRYLRAKAKLLGLNALTWYDLFAPVGESREWSYEEGRRFIIEQFGTYSDKLSRFAERAYNEQWIDAEPRPGKTTGGYCMPLRNDESRVFVNFQPAFDGVSTIAHELGHAYHNLCEASRTMLQRDTPMPLAETASIFCETIIRNAGLRQAADGERLGILEASLQGDCQVVVDITSRFLFESRLFEQRRQRELSVEELNELMLQAQRDTYGDGLDGSVLHPYMWAAKGHYYSTGRFFYNYPYMFGLLFGLGLYARYESDPNGFRQGYDDLLASTGSEDAATLAARFGIDLRSPEFWRSSLDVIRRDIDQFVELVEQQA